MTGNRHDANRFRRYCEIHETVLDQFRSRDFVRAHTLEFSTPPHGIRLTGEIACLGQIVITVDKFLTVLENYGDDALVRTRWYSYNASIRGFNNIIRFDNQDEDYLRPGHFDEHHKHVFDWRTGKEQAGSPYWIGIDGWPTLGEFLQLIQDWYWQNCADLPDPDRYPDLGLRDWPSSLDAE